MTLFYVVVSYRELMRQGEGDVMKLRWWFAYGQTLKNVSGAGLDLHQGMMLLGRRDFVIVAGDRRWPTSISSRSFCST